ncbi:PREDICTED: zinc finger BED domain-containing protein 5-like [Xyrichtys novacula]|uniref:PREDICTED: zinc finger BED domain-containing protein 5-like n=1 Tax=Xyrichtys novacula TaxID=13765 RepID=A0AAV1GRP9_XYRNO|nr:PREDICTED: zinc finger BED domain-containing protein 5-like [Xyrichtys novacula]
MDQFWLASASEYPSISNHRIKQLLLFPTTYWCEIAFSTLDYMKKKTRSQLSVEQDLLVALSSMPPRRTEEIASSLGTTVSHLTHNMPPLTSPSGCVSCASLAEKILVLEGRISSLYKIQESEKHLDTIVFKPVQSDTSSGLEPEPTAAAVSTSTPEPAVTAHYPAGESASPPEPVTTHRPAPPPLPISDDSWARFGAKP